MTDQQKVKRNVTRENFNQICWARGFRGVAGLARHLARNRVSLHRAVRYPSTHKPTYNLIVEALSHDA
jgi:hypothetical protein